MAETHEDIINNALLDLQIAGYFTAEAEKYRNSAATRLQSTGVTEDNAQMFVGVLKPPVDLKAFYNSDTDVPVLRPYTGERPTCECGKTKLWTSHGWLCPVVYVARRARC